MQRMPSDNSTGVSLFVVVHLTTMNTFQGTTCFPFFFFLFFFFFPVYLQIENRRWNKATCRPARNEDNSAISFYFGLTVSLSLSLSLSQGIALDLQVFPGPVVWSLRLFLRTDILSHWTNSIFQGVLKPPADPFLSQRRPIHAFSSYFWTIHCNIILPDTRWLQRQRFWLVFGRCWDQIWALDAEELTDVFHGLIRPSRQNG